MNGQPVRPEPTIQFELADVKRVPVYYDTATHLAFCQSTQEAIKFPTALAEVFGASDEDVSLSLAVTPKHLHHISDDDEELLLQIIVNKGGEKHISGEDCTIFMNISTLREERIGRQQGFNASLAAKEVFKMYKNYHRKQDYGLENNSDSSSGGNSH
jgi:hypothetical protein